MSDEDYKEDNLVARAEDVVPLSCFGIAFSVACWSRFWAYR